MNIISHSSELKWNDNYCAGEIRYPCEIRHRRPHGHNNMGNIQLLRLES